MGKWLTLFSFVYVMLFCIAPTEGVAKMFNMDSTAKVEDQFMLQLDTTMAIREFEQNLVDKVGTAKILNQFHLGDLTIILFNCPADQIQKVAEIAGVKAIEPDNYVNTTVYYNKPAQRCVYQESGRILWGLSRTATRKKPENYSKARYRFLEDDGLGVDVYVVDTGLFSDHDEFSGISTRHLVAPSLLSLIEDSANDDTIGHGTSVAALVAGKTYGIAKRASIVSVKVFGDVGSTPSSVVIEGLELILSDFTKKQTNLGKKRKAVVNMSLGGGAFLMTDDAVSALIDAGLTVVVSAGNGATVSCSRSPARNARAITVGATDIEDNIAFFSNFGPCTDILAPGYRYVTANIGSPTATRLFAGTSGSAPLVAAVVARMLSQLCEVPSTNRIKAWLLDTATKNAINLGQTLATPNLLLYMGCQAEDLKDFKRCTPQKGDYNPRPSYKHPNNYEHKKPKANKPKPPYKKQKYLWRRKPKSDYQEIYPVDSENDPEEFQSHRTTRDRTYYNRGTHQKDEFSRLFDTIKKLPSSKDYKYTQYVFEI